MKEKPPATRERPGGRTKEHPLIDDDDSTPTARAKRALESLTHDELADLLMVELDRRRLDDAGNPTDPPGLYMAAATAVLALLGQRQDDAGEAMAEHLAAVGRGVQIRSTTAEDAPMIREIALLVELTLQAPPERIDDPAVAIALTLEERFSRRIDVERVRAALERPYPRRITEIVGAAGIVPFDPDDRDDWRRAHRNVSQALKHH